MTQLASDEARAHHALVEQAGRLFPGSTELSTYTYDDFRGWFFNRLKALRKRLNSFDRWRVGCEMATLLFQRSEPYWTWASRLLEELQEHLPPPIDGHPYTYTADPDSWPPVYRIHFTGDPLNDDEPLWSTLPAELRQKSQEGARR